MRFSFKDRIRSFRFAFNGLFYAFKTQHNIWIHTIITVFVITISILLNISIYEWCFIIFAIGLVFSAELINTAIEKLTDLVSPDHNNKAKVIKDLSAAAVLLSAITAVAIGCLIFIPKLYNLL